MSAKTILNVVSLLLMAAAAHAGSFTFVSAATGGLTCSQTDPSSSSCSVGNQFGYLANPPTSYSTASASASLGMLDLSAFGYGSDVNFPSTPCCGIGAQSTSEANFSDTLEVIGGVGQVLVVAVGSSTCSSISGITGSQSCGTPQIDLGSTISDGGDIAYLATYGVPFTFSGSAFAQAFADYNESWISMADLSYPLSSFALLNQAGTESASGTLLVLADAPEPAPVWLISVGAGCLFLRRRWITWPVLRKAHDGATTSHDLACR